LSNLATSKSNNYVHMFEIFAFFLNGDIDHKDTPSDQHMNITLAYTGVMKLFFRLAIEKRPRYLNLLISHGKTGLLYKSAIDRIENKVREKQSQNRRSSFGAKGKEEKETLERKLKEDLAKLEKILYFNKDLVTTLRDVFKHNILRSKPFAEENPVYEDFFKGAPTRHWIRGYNIHSISIPVKSCGVSFMEVIRKPAGMIRKYASIEGFANEVLTPECAYLWLYDNGYPRGRNPEDSLPVRATQPDLLEQIDEHMPFSKVQVALVFVAPGQSSWVDIFDNSSGSVRYTEFLEQLGEKVCLQRKGPEHNHAVSGLDFSRHGKFTYLHCDDISKIQFTVATVLPTNKDHQKLATIGNREIMITWDESGGTYLPGTQDSDFPFVEIIIRPVTSTIVKIDTALTSQFVSRKTRLPSKFKPFHKLSSSSQTESESFKSLELGAAGGPIFLSDKNLPAAMIAQVLNHSLTLSFTDSIRRVNHSDSYMEAMPAYHRLTLIQNIREKEVQHQKSYLDKIGHHDDDFDLDYCL